MPPLATEERDEPSAFTVINNDEPAAEPAAPRPRHVQAVRPLQRSPPPPPAPGPEFSRALDRKLRRLQAAAAPQAPTMRRARTDSQERPRFVTTVKTGQFLLPPPELATLLGLESLYPSPRESVMYSYASRPQPVAARTARVAPQPRASRSKRSVSDTSPCKPRVAPRDDPRNAPRADPRTAPRDDPGGPRSRLAAAFGNVRLLAAASMGMKPQTGSVAYANVMHDKRVVRGSTFAAHPLCQGDGVESAAQRAARTRRRALARRAAAMKTRPGTPPPVLGRKHHPIQTEYYLEELFDKAQEMEVGVQTDLFVDRPATPIYVPAKTGCDAWTQIYPGDLFDFDLEVQPILEVLVGKTSEQALAEVAQEEELATLREQQRRYQELRDAERAERARLAAQDLRLNQEKERRVSEARVAQQSAIEARERAAAAVLVQGYMAELLPSVLAGLRDQGYLMETIERGVDDEFMPWLVNEVSQEIESIITSRDVITEIVRDVVEARAELYRTTGEAEWNRVEPEDSITPRSDLGEGEEEEEKQPEVPPRRA
ncbi:radial spoke protein 3 domain-containing protein [Phthorimaea operculella]|nr:radial spoke protein 3 domain-containing protein [Phthorimaea operculella]